LKILLCSHLFYPSIGGSEEVGKILAWEFTRLGHEVKVITSTISMEDENFPFKVIRNPGAADLIKSVVWCDVVFHNNISLRTGWPLIFIQRPWVVVHHTWIARSDGSFAWQDRLKRFLLRFGTNISVSRAVAGSLPVPSTVIANPYRADLFQILSNSSRNLELVFLGRLVSEKGIDLLLHSLVRLKSFRLFPHLTIIGSGGELEMLQQLVIECGLKDQVCFVGPKEGQELVDLLNRHKILVIPSRCRETFGLAALEGIACGLVIVGASGGGLAEAVGPCGVIFQNSDVDELTDILLKLLTEPARSNVCLAGREQHLKAFQPATIARSYLEVFKKAIGISQFSVSSNDPP
jgi:glycogen(starch) synthase